MSSNNTDDTEALIIKLLKKLQRKGKNIKSLLWRLMDEFEDEQGDEKNDEIKFNGDNHKITLLYESTSKKLCKVGHTIEVNKQKHLSIEPCIMCGHKNNNKRTKTDNQMLQFLDKYDTKQIPFGPNEDDKQDHKTWQRNGDDKRWPLHYAAMIGDIAKIKQLCKNKNINIDEKMIDWNDKSPICCAARYGQLESVIELIKNSSNPMPPPDKANNTPYDNAVYFKHKAITQFFTEYVQYLYNFDINNNTNVECYQCYIYDSHFNKHLLNGTMSKYVYCENCTVENVKKVKDKLKNSKIIERRIIKTIKENASISVDTLCQMKDVKSLHSILKEIMVCGATYAYTLWLLDIDNFKAINTCLTHAIADTKMQALGQVLKRFETMTWKQWRANGCLGMSKVWAFRQGGDEFGLVVRCNYQKKNVLQNFYEILRNDINKIKLENMKAMTYITVSIGVCFGHQIVNYEDMMKKADEAAEMVKKSGKNGIAIYAEWTGKIYKNFNDVPQ